MAPLQQQANLLPRPVQLQMDSFRKQYHGLDNLITRLRTLTGAPLSVQQELVREAQEESKAIAEKIEDLRLMADEQDKEADRTMILVMLEKIEVQYKQQQQSLRQAKVSSKQAIDQQAKSDRELLFRGSKSAMEISELRRRGGSNSGGAASNDYLLKTSKEHNDSLSRTIKLMQQEVERTAHSAKVIDDSSKMLRSTVNEYQTYSEVLNRGKQLITKLNQADWTDRLLIGFGLLVFSLVVLYILKKRIASPGISLLGYLFMPLRWFLSLFIPSLRSTLPELANSHGDHLHHHAGEFIKDGIQGVVANNKDRIVGAAHDTFVKVVTSTAAAPTGILGILDAIVGE